MSLLHRFKTTRSLSFSAAASKALRLGRRTLVGVWGQALYGRRCTYVELGAAARQGRAPEIPAGILNPISSTLAAVAGNALAHRFDLLGSGLTRVAHGMQCAGFEGACYPAVTKAPDVSPGNRARSRNIRALIGPGYYPIDWQIDFKSGYRWPESQWFKAVRFGHLPGVDIKVPWELARLQHLPQLALAYILALSGEAGFQPPKAYQDEFRNQALDFLAANPPGFGVNWACAMDVAIRAANLVVAMDLFAKHGAEFDDAFKQEFAAGILAHGRHVFANLEWRDKVRGNHFLADIAGLLFVAAYLEPTPETEDWLAFATDQLIGEVERQFTSDGANFEASTCYHRLSAEMAAYGAALILGLDGSERFPPWFFPRLERMAQFMVDATKPNRRVVQIGDTDSGRFFKLCPLRGESEDVLDCRATVAAINGLFSRKDLAAFSGPSAEVESAMTAGLSGWTKVQSAAPAAASAVTGAVPSAIPKGREVVVELPGVLKDLKAAAYPDFGLFIWRSRRFFLSVRCGPVGQEGNGGHAHNDQLAVELNIDGEDWLADPGSYVYTPSPGKRNAYRSVLAHAGPRMGTREPARLDLGMFRLEDAAKAQCLRFDEAGFVGVHYGFGAPVYRTVTLEKDRLVITDSIGNAERFVVGDAAALRELFPCSLPFSPGYGEISSSS